MIALLLILIWIAGFAFSLYIMSLNKDISLPHLIALIFLWYVPVGIWLLDKSGDLVVIKRRKPRE